jgi:hypothetical protein
MINLLPHDQFGRLRLADFASAEVEITEVEDWEYLDRMWIGEVIGFTEWLRPVEKPDVLGSLSLDLLDLPQEMSQRIFDALRLPLSRGMKYDQVKSVLGEPVGADQFISSQTTYDFHCGSKWQYEIGCTIRDENGLSYLTIATQ